MPAFKDLPGRYCFIETIFFTENINIISSFPQKIAIDQQESL